MAKYFLGVVLDTKKDLWKGKDTVKTVSKEINIGPIKGSITGIVSRYGDETDGYLVLREGEKRFSPFINLIEEDAYKLNTTSTRSRNAHLFYMAADMN